MKMIHYLFVLMFGVWLAFQVSDVVGKVYTEQTAKVCKVLRAGR